MFKGNLIENKSYYKLRSKQLLFILLPSIAIGFLVNFDKMPLWITIGAIVFYVVVVIMTFKNHKAMQKVANKKIEIDQNKIVIKEANGTVIEIIEVENVNKLIVKDDYKMAQETLKDLQEEIKGNPEEHYLILESNKMQKRYDFVIESYYMAKQLKKLVQEWQNKNVLIEYTNE